MYNMCCHERSSPLRVRWPHNGDFLESEGVLENNRPNGKPLKRLFGVFDGGNLPCADYVDFDALIAFNEGYTARFEVTILLVFDFKGVIIHAALNYPGF